MTSSQLETKWLWKPFESVLRVSITWLLHFLVSWLLLVWKILFFYYEKLHKRCTVTSKPFYVILLFLSHSWNIKWKNIFTSQLRLVSLINITQMYNSFRINWCSTSIKSALHKSVGLKPKILFLYKTETFAIFKSTSLQITTK